MNILLLGTRGAGKTTLMHSMYGYFQTPREGLTITADSGHDKLMDGYRGIMKGIYPNADNQRKKYQMALKYCDEKIFDFSWIDYYGGIYEDNYNASEEDLKKLQKDILNSDGLICFFDSSQYHKNNDYFLQTIQALGQIFVHIKKVFPVSFIVTKSDLLSQPMYKSTLRAPLEPIIGSISRNGHICGSLFQSSCGRTFRNVDTPLFFMLIFGVILKAKMEYKEIEERRTNLSKRSIWKDIADWADSRLNGYGTDYEILNRRIDDYNKIVGFQNDAIKRMASRLENAIIFPDNIREDLFD